MEVEFDVKIDSGILYDYMLHHTYTSFAGVVGTTVGALILVAFGMTGHVIYLIAGLVILLYQPGSLLLKAQQQALTHPAFKQPLHYKMTEEGVEVSQGDMVEFQKWEDMVKAVSTGRSIILYTTRINASIFPRRDLKDSLTKAVEMISTHMPPKKVNIRM